jgi:hypothetical protein
VKARATTSALLLTASLTAVAITQPRLARIAHKVKQRDDVFPLPPSAQLHAATLGWNAAAVDVLWATLLSEYGIHWSEHREFLNAKVFVDAILELEPTYAPMYLFVGTILAWRPLQGTEDDVKLARSYLERGTLLRPNDSRVWMEYGTFTAFIAPSFLHDPEERSAWRRAGAMAMGHAAELSGDAERVAQAADVLRHSGAASDAIPYLEQAYAFTERPEMAEIHAEIGQKLDALKATTIIKAADAAARAFEKRWERDLRFVERDWYAVIGPLTDPAACAGFALSDDPKCARDWTRVAAGDAEGAGDVDER